MIRIAARSCAFIAALMSPPYGSADAATAPDAGEANAVGAGGAPVLGSRSGAASAVLLNVTHD